MSAKAANSQSILSDMQPSRAIVKLAIPATLALLAKAVYNLVDTAYIGMLNSDIALTAVGVTVPLLLIMVSIENIFAAGAAVLAGRQLGAFILILPRLFGVAGIYASQPAADVLTILVCVLSVPAMKRIASRNMRNSPTE